MTELAAKLLDLTAEYADAKTRAEGWADQYGTNARSPETIAAEYGDTLRAFLNS